MNYELGVKCDINKQLAITNKKAHCNQQAFQNQNKWNYHFNKVIPTENGYSSGPSFFLNISVKA